MNSYFPISYRIDDKSVLLIGGGSISDFKFQKIASFGPKRLRVIAKEFTKSFNKIENPCFEYVEKSFDFNDVEGFDIVIVAIDDANLQREIYKHCNSKKIFCNCVDLIDCCDFIFPSIVKRGDINIAVNTNGLLPGFSAVMKTYLEKILPNNLENEFYKIVELRKNLSPGKERMQLIRKKAQDYFDTIVRGN